jgi:hypothetical protein
MACQRRLKPKATPCPSHLIAKIQQDELEQQEGANGVKRQRKFMHDMIGFWSDPNFDLIDVSLCGKPIRKLSRSAYRSRRTPGR